MRRWGRVPFIDARHIYRKVDRGRHVGVAEGNKGDFDFQDRLQELHRELEVPSSEARRLEGRMSKDIGRVQEAIAE